ncbi:hypothetical protein C3F00_037330 [Pseudomonas sp. MWU13-2860]|nr:hypothetical protein C3F00_037330 [Pseudomonas sp. MWU13-2860]
MARILLSVEFRRTPILHVSGRVGSMLEVAEIFLGPVLPHAGNTLHPSILRIWRSMLKQILLFMIHLLPQVMTLSLA